MCLLTEAIKILDGKIYNANLHSARMNKAREDLFRINENINLDKVLVVPEFASNGLYKCRITYGREINNIEWIKYQPRIIKSLKLVRCDEIDYSYKYNDRAVFNKLMKENNCGENDAVIIIKSGRITDSYFSNVALHNGKEWHTPQYPLLAGTKRAELLKKGEISEKDILEKDFFNYEGIKLINAMMDFRTSPTFLVGDVVLPDLH